MRMFRSWDWIRLSVWALLLPLPLRAVTPQFAADSAAIARAPHRLTGSAEYAAAADYVAARLKAIGCEPVLVQTFPVARLALKECTLTLKEQALPLLPVRPDGVMPAATSPEGISGNLLLAGRGRIEDYGDRSPEGRIVVLDFNGDGDWLRAFRLGAKAVVFTAATDAATGQYAHHSNANYNLPRFYFPGDPALLTEGAPVVLRSSVTWERGIGRNVIGFIPGTAPKLSLEQEEVLLLSANLDTFGEVPDQSPGGRQAVNCAALLDIGARLKQSPPKRNVALVFFDSQAYGHAGAIALYRVLEQDYAPLKLANRQAALDGEERFLTEAAAALQDVPALRASKDLKTMIRRLKFKADEHAFAIKADMEDLRKAGKVLEREASGSSAAQASQTRYQAEQERYQAEKDQWNDLRRCLAQEADAASATRPPLDQLLIKTMAEVRADYAVRQQEWDVLAAALAADLAVGELLGKRWITLHISLNLGDTSPQWGLILGGDSFVHCGGDQPGLYGKIQKTFKEAAATVQVPGFCTATVDGSVNPRLFWPGPLVHSGEAAGRFGIYNLVLGTIQEAMRRDGTPVDSVARLNLDRIEGQAAEIAVLLGAVGSQEGLSLRRSIVPEKNYFIATWKNGVIDGPTVMGMTLGSSMPNKPMPGALVQLRINPFSTFAYQPAKIPGFNDFQVVMSDANAGFGFGPVPQDGYRYLLHGFATKFDERGVAVAVSDRGSLNRSDTRLNLFPCVTVSRVSGREVVTGRSGAVVLPPVAEPADIQVMQAISNGALDTGKSFVFTHDGLCFWYAERRVEGVKYFGLESAVGLVNGDLRPGFRSDAEKKTPYGQGFSQLKPWDYPVTAMRSAADLWRLNEFRLNILRERGVMNSSIEELHGRAEDLLTAANSGQSLAASQAYAASAFFAERPVYTTVRSALDDLVRAVLILLALAVPFAFALERLLIGSTNIYRQILWFCGFFAVTFLLLYLVHPAFAVSNQPVIIFLAFALIVLSGLVIFVIMQKFEYELKVIQGLTSTVHTADVSRFGTMMAAMSMGISTMRRRPLRTALTALTITLLTFTILNFASFDTRTGVVTLYEGATPKYTGVLVHKVNWVNLQESLLDLFQGRWGSEATVLSRYWLPAGTDPKAETGGPLVTRADGTHAFALRGLLGLDPREIAQRPDFQELFKTPPEALTNGVFMTRTLAEKIGVTVGQAVMVGGVPLTVAGLLEPSDLERVRDMDRTSILPVDFAAMTSSQGNQAQAAGAVADPLAAAQNKQDWVSLPIDSTVIVSNEAARKMGANLRVVTFYTKTADAAQQTAEDLARILPLPVIATRPEGVYTHVLAPTLAAKGVKDLLFPILLGGMVIFGTMLGSVADREKEIYTFSALGLAPAHVATLFFAEALVYSFIGGLGGYLLAQGVMKLLALCVGIGLLKAMPEMNYSSINAIVTILIVMCTVLISAMYPAYKASRSANPGILRTWRLPAPDHDVFHMVFPFTVSQYDITGVISFLKEHFDNFSDTSLGVFMARDTTIARDGQSLGMRSHVALAPFDLGVTQGFRLYSSPSEIAGIDEVKIEIERKSGQHKDWARLNKVLLNDLRRQFLIWRSLPATTMDIYRQRTLQVLGDSAAADNAAPATAAGTAKPTPRQA